jgi:hypothetical protein
MSHLLRFSGCLLSLLVGLLSSISQLSPILQHVVHLLEGFVTPILVTVFAGSRWAQEWLPDSHNHCSMADCCRFTICVLPGPVYCYDLAWMVQAWVVMIDGPQLSECGHEAMGMQG